MTLAQQAQEIVRLLGRRYWKIATAESCTGGMAAQYITSAPGASAVFELGVVSYANRIKTEELGVPEDMLAAFGAVSEPVAIQMAQGVWEKAGSNLGVSTTGIAGPDGGTPQKPVGTVHIALCGPQICLHRKLTLGPEKSREEIRRETVEQLFRLILEVLQENGG